MLTHISSSPPNTMTDLIACEDSLWYLTSTKSPIKRPRDTDIGYTKYPDSPSTAYQQRSKELSSTFNVDYLLENTSWDQKKRMKPTKNIKSCRKIMKNIFQMTQNMFFNNVLVSNLKALLKDLKLGIEYDVKMLQFPADNSIDNMASYHDVLKIFQQVIENHDKKEKDLKKLIQSNIIEPAIMCDSYMDTRLETIQKHELFDKFAELNETLDELRADEQSSSEEEKMQVIPDIPTDPSFPYLQGLSEDETESDNNSISFENAVMKGPQAQRMIQGMEYLKKLQVV